ncbi:uncharacterized protein [Primulina eburnea]|uniref:uncharacterized protein n=1 Tax=Primulina eburnea TaxID=1245227 RepID=UPI003C6CB9AA
MAGRYDSSSKDEKQEISGRYGESSYEYRRKRRERVEDLGSESSGREVMCDGEERKVGVDAKKSGRKREEDRGYGRRDLYQGSDSERGRRRRQNGSEDKERGKGERRGERKYPDRGVDDEDDRTIGRRREINYTDEDAENGHKGRERERDSESDRRDKRRRNEGAREDDDEKRPYRGGVGWSCGVW